MARRSRQATAVAEEHVLDVPVTYANVSIGDKTARIGLVIDRSQLKLHQADRVLTSKRLRGRIMAAPPEDRNHDQARLPEMEEPPVVLEGIFDVKGLGVSEKNISCGLTFALASIDVESLAHFAKRIGKLTVYEVEENEGGDDE